MLGNPSPPRQNAVTPRAALLCLLLTPVSVYWQIQMETVRNSTHPSALALPFHVVFILLFLSGANRLWARVSPRIALTQGELLLTYLVLAISSAVAGIDMLQVMIPAITYGFAHALANGWDATITPLLPPSLTIADPAVYERYYLGYGSVWEPAIFAAWLPVVCRRTVFVSLLMWVMLCLNAVIRRAWTESEHLTFPMVQLPLKITEPETWSRAGLFGSGLFGRGLWSPPCRICSTR